MSPETARALPDLVRAIQHGEELVGHPGEAYGFYGGAWAVRDGSIAFAYCVTGADRSGGVSRHPVSEFTRWEQELFTRVWQEI